MSEPADVIALHAEEPGEAAEESRQKAIGEYLAPGYEAVHVPALNDLVGVRAFQPLLRELLLGGPDDFWVRLVVMRELSSDAETSWTQETLAQKFSYLADEPRRDIIRRLARGGWLSYADSRYSVTALGEAATALTGLLGDLANRAGDLGLVVHSLKMAKEYGLDSRAQLDQLRNKLSKIGEEMEKAYDSKSEHAILQARTMLESSLPWVEAARQVLEKYSLETPEEHERVRSTHDLLSRLHHWVSALQRALNDIGKRRVHLGEGGLTMRDVTAFLARADVATLCALANGVVHFPTEQRFVIVDNMLSEAEYELCVRELPDEERRGWSAPEQSTSIEPELAAGGPIEIFVENLRELVASGRSTPVPKFVMRESWAATAYRFTLLTLAGGRMDEGELPPEAAGPGRLLAAVPVDVQFDHTQRDRVEGEFASEMTTGWIIPRREIPAATGTESEAADDAAGPAETVA
jgi:hypothetical protein